MSSPVPPGRHFKLEEEARKQPEFHEGTYLQRAGFRLFQLILLLTGLIVIGLLVYLLSKTPSVPAHASNAPVDTTYLAIVTGERAAAVDNVVKLGQLLLIGICLPLLTAILGYIFGTKER